MDENPYRSPESSPPSQARHAYDQAKRDRPDVRQVVASALFTLMVFAHLSSRYVETRESLGYSISFVVGSIFTVILIGLNASRFLRSKRD